MFAPNIYSVIWKFFKKISVVGPILIAFWNEGLQRF